MGQIGLKDPGPQIQKSWYMYNFCWWKDQLVMHYSLKADISIIWKAEAKLTQYHPLGHTFYYLKESIDLCIPVASTFKNSFNTCCLHLINLLSFVAHSLLYFFQEKEKEKQKVSLARRYFWDSRVRALLSPR